MVRRTDAPYRGKRAFDLALLAVVSPPALVISAACALAVRLTSPGPVFFRQERIGMDGRPFRVWKFRTMVAGDNPIFPDATRITSAGRVLRRLSLDELPQLLNVAVGEMSVVGPRPTLAYQVDRYDDHQRRRLSVRPGLTGLAQVNGRNALSWGDRIDFDVRYVETQSVVTDLRILAQTLQTMLSGEGVEGHPTDDPLAAPEVAGPDGASPRPEPPA
jgi:sugar transferase EpsL